MTHPAYRKWFGILFVTATGFTFALISQVINLLFMPGIPLYQPPFGALGNTLLYAIIGFALGILVAWPETGSVGVLWSSLLGSLFIVIASLLIGEDQSVTIAHKLAALIIIFVPTAGALAPLMILLRWIIGREVFAYRDACAGRPTPPFRRYAFPVGLVLIAGALGITALYNDVGRAVTTRMHLLIQQGMQVQSAAVVPASLNPPDVNDFLNMARGSYTLQWDRDEKNRFAIPRPAGNFYDQSTVIARFENGYLLACMFPSKTGQPTCRDF